MNISAMGNYMFKASCFVIHNISYIIFPLAVNPHVGVPSYFTPNYCIATHLVPLQPDSYHSPLPTVFHKMLFSVHHITSLLKFLYWILISDQIRLHTNTFYSLHVNVSFVCLLKSLKSRLPWSFIPWCRTRSIFPIFLSAIPSSFKFTCMFPHQIPLFMKQSWNSLFFITFHSFLL